MPALLLLLASAALSATAHDGQAPAADARLAAVQVKGVQRYSLADVSRLSGLAIGKPAALSDLTAAANRLAATGLFNTVKYTYNIAAGLMTVTFEIEEAAWSVPVILDNFVWTSDADLTAAVRQEVPSFDGTAPLNAGAADFIAAALQRVLDARGIPGHVEVNPQVAVGSTAVKYLYAVKDPSPRVCALRVAGASAVSERELLAQLGAVVGQDYSRFFLATASSGTLVDMYRQRGYWRAAFATPSAALGSCDGVAATLTVTEGSPYAWDRATWTGNAVLDATALDALLGMKSGDVADATRIETGLRKVREAYGKQGYIMEREASAPQLDDAQHRAAFQIKVAEGPQFHVGTLEFVGLKDTDASNLLKQWRLKPGDVYDESKVQEYQRQVLGPLRTSAGGRAVTEFHQDPDRHIVDLRVVFK